MTKIKEIWQSLRYKKILLIPFVLLFIIVVFLYLDYAQIVPMTFHGVPQCGESLIDAWIMHDGHDCGNFFEFVLDPMSFHGLLVLVFFVPTFYISLIIFCLVNRRWLCSLSSLLGVPFFAILLLNLYRPENILRLLAISAPILSFIISLYCFNKRKKLCGFLLLAVLFIIYFFLFY